MRLRAAAGARQAGRRARANQASGASRTYVLCEDDAVVGYYALAAGAGTVAAAARRVVATSDAVGIRGLLVHAISDEARTFYDRLGLAPSPLDPMTLIVTIGDLRGAEGRCGEARGLWQTGQLIEGDASRWLMRRRTRGP